MLLSKVLLRFYLVCKSYRDHTGILDWSYLHQEVGLVLGRGVIGWLRWYGGGCLGFRVWGLGSMVRVGWAHAHCVMEYLFSSLPLGWRGGGINGTIRSNGMAVISKADCMVSLGTRSQVQKGGSQEGSGNQLAVKFEREHNVGGWERQTRMEARNRYNEIAARHNNR